MVTEEQFVKLQQDYLQLASVVRALGKAFQEHVADSQESCKQQTLSVMTIAVTLSNKGICTADEMKALRDVLETSIDWKAAEDGDTKKAISKLMERAAREGL